MFFFPSPRRGALCRIGVVEFQELVVAKTVCPTRMSPPKRWNHQTESTEITAQLSRTLLFSRYYILRSALRSMIKKIAKIIGSLGAQGASIAPRRYQIVLPEAGSHPLQDRF